MPHRITTGTELVLGGLTFVSTLLAGNFITDVVTGIITYVSARLFWYYFGNKIKVLIKKIKIFSINILENFKK